MRFVQLDFWFLLLCACLRVASSEDVIEVPPATEPTSAPAPTPEPPEIRKLYEIVLFWPVDGVIREADLMFKEFFLPKLNRTCLSNGVALPNDFLVLFRALILSETPTFNELTALYATLKIETRFQFAGSLMAPTSESSRRLFKSMGTFYHHWVEPPPFSVLVPGLLNLIRAVQQPATGIVTDLAENRELTVVVGATYKFSEVHQLMKSFDRGVLCYRMGNADFYSTIYSAIYNSNSTTILVLANRDDTDSFVSSALTSSLWSPDYRWILFDTGRIFENRLDILNKRNISSLEYGPYGPEEQAYFYLGSDRILIYDLLNVWTAYMADMSCGVKVVDGRQVRGLTGLFTLYSNGTLVRNEWAMLVYRSMLAGGELAGNWSSSGTFKMSSPRPRSMAREDLLKEYRGKIFYVFFITGSPFSRFKKGMENRSDLPLEKRLEGLAFDMCLDILRNLNITNYNFQLVPDNNYGIEMPNGDWTGVINLLINGAASLACVDLTVTTPRAGVIDFTMPYLKTNISILRKVNKTSPVKEMFQFVTPFNIDVWLCIGGATLAVAVLLTILHRINPNRQLFDFRYSLFFSFASALQGIVGHPPDRPSGRIVVMAYWLLVTLLLIAYVGNYAAIRTLDKLEVDISTASSLLEQTSYTYGTLANSSMALVFKESTFADMRLIYERMKRFKNGLFANRSVGFEAVKRGDFAMIYETPANEYQQQLICDSIVTGHFENVDIAFGLPRRSELREIIDDEIGKLINKGRVDELHKKYFIVQGSDLPKCVQSSIAQIIPEEPPFFKVDPSALTLHNTFGLLIVNFLGCCLTLLVAGLEAGLNALKQSRRDDQQENVDQAMGISLRRHKGRKMANVLQFESQA